MTSIKKSKKELNFLKSISGPTRCAVEIAHLSIQDTIYVQIAENIKQEQENPSRTKKEIKKEEDAEVKKELKSPKRKEEPPVEETEEERKERKRLEKRMKGYAYEEYDPEKEQKKEVRNLNAIVPLFNSC